MNTNSQVFEAEMKFLKRKLILNNLAWEARPGISQIVSPIMSELQAQKLLGDLKDVLGKKAGLVFPKLAFIAKAKAMRGFQYRVAISISVLRHFFAGEIDAGGGGGRGYNPLRVAVTPRP